MANAKTAKGKKLAEQDSLARFGDPDALVKNFDLFAAHIEAVSEAIKTIMDGSTLNKRAVLVLIHDTLPPHPKKAGKILGMRDLEKFLDHLEVMADYLVKEEEA